jgi:hypothetical protein
MAAKNNPPPEAAAQNPTPENTPVPGGGRYRWSDSAPHWVEIDDNGVPVQTSASATPITLE